MTEATAPARCANCGAPYATGRRNAGAGAGRCAACYSYVRRRGRDNATRRVPAVIAAWADGQLSEGQAAELLGVDRVTARARFQELVAAGASLWRPRPKRAPRP